MDYTASYHQTYLKETQYNEPASRELSYQSPYFVFEFNLLVLYSRRLAFYLERLKKMGIIKEAMNEDFLKIFPSGVLDVEYPQEQFFEFLTILYDDITQAKELYVSICEKNDLEIETPKPKLKDPRKLSFSDLIKEGQKEFDRKYKGFTLDQMNLVELYLYVFKSAAVHFSALKTFGIHDDKTFDYVIFLFSLKPIFRGKAFQEVIKTLVELDNHLLLRLHEIKREKYGEIEPTEISTSIRPNKAILVSGSNLKELELLLEFTKDKRIDIYTHGNMLLAHAYPKFKTYPHLVGHFGKKEGNHLLDFAEFPGSVFLTRYSFLSLENFYRGRIYTTDTIAPQGIGIIKDNNFEPLIQSALRAEGFEEKIQKPPIKFNFSEKEFFNKVAEIEQKVEKGEIKHLFTIGIPGRTMQREYFDKFLNLLGSDCFVLSFFYSNQADDALYIQSDYTFLFLCKAFELLTKKINIGKLNLTMLFTRCEIHTFSNLLYMKQIGTKNIYLSDCSPNLVNPALITFIKKMFDVKSYTNPEDDLKDMINS